MDSSHWSQTPGVRFVCSIQPRVPTTCPELDPWGLTQARRGQPALLDMAILRPRKTHTEHAFHGQKFFGSSSAHEAATRPVHAPLGGHPHARVVITHAVGTQQPCPRLPLWGGHGHALGGKSRCMAEPETRWRIQVPVLSSPLWDSTRARGVITRAVWTQ